MRFVVALATVLAIGLPAPRVAAHVAPADDANNRYVKLTALGDRIRLAYTVFYGQVPGASLRRTIDASHDGEIDAAESQAFADAVAKGVAAALDVTIDGARSHVTWSQVSLGLGTPEVVAGGFSIDLVAWFCLARARGPHAVRLRDHLALDRPGETEVVVEDSPGVAIGATRIGGARDETHAYKRVGPGALDPDGLELSFTVSDRAPAGSDAICHRPERSGGLTWWIGGAALAALALAGLAWRRHKRAPRRPDHPTRSSRPARSRR